MDDVDRCQEQEELFRRKAINAARQHKSSTVSSHRCIDCGKPIPEARRKAAPGCDRCVSCAQKHESLKRR